jgi:hypothetical protein
VTLEPLTRYRLSFAAKCNTGHDVDVSLFQNGSPYANYGLAATTFNLTSSWATYSVEFTTANFSTQVSDGRLMFWLAPYAASGDEYWFDDVSLATVGDSATVPQAPQPASPADAATGVDTAATLSWNASSGATSYWVQLSTSSQFSSLLVDDSTLQSTSRNVSGLSRSTVYYWRVSAANAAGRSSWSASRSFTTAAADTGGTNVLVNGGFEQGTDSWAWFTNGDGYFEASSSAYEGSLSGQVTVTTAGTNMQLYQSGFTLEPNASYRLRFRSRASASRSVEIILQKHTSPYTGFGLDQTESIGTAWALHEIDFTTTGFSGNTTDTRLRFWFVGGAQDGDTFWFDSVELKKR